MTHAAQPGVARSAEASVIGPLPASAWAESIVSYWKHAHACGQLDPSLPLELVDLAPGQGATVWVMLNAVLERAAQGVECTTAVHICYGYGIKANIEWKKTLGGEWRQYEQTFPRLAASSIDQVSLECANSRVPIDLIGLLEGKDVLVGAIDVASDRVESAEDVAAVIRSALRFVPAARLFPCTNCGMVPLRRELARGKLQALGAGAALVRRELGLPTAH